MWSKHWPWLLIVTVEMMISVPFLLGHPQMVRDDWLLIARTHEHGVWNTVYPELGRQQPPARLAYAFIYGLASVNLMAAHLAMVAATAIIAVLVYFVSRQFWSPVIALMVALIWVILPTHLSLDHWFAAAHIDMSMLLLLGGLLGLRRLPLMSAVAFAVAILTYEACVPLVLVILIVAIKQRWLSRRNAICVAALCAMATVYAVIAAWHFRTQIWVSPVQSLYRNIGVFIEVPTLALVIALVVVVVSFYRVVKAATKRSLGVSDSLLAAGLVLLVVGTVPFLRNGTDVMFVGLGDRANYISSVGAACIIVGLVHLVSHKRRSVAVMAGLVMLALLPLHVQRSVGWARVSNTVVDAGDSLLPASTVTLNGGAGKVPGYDLGLSADLELTQYLQSGWHHPPAEVRVGDGVDARSLMVRFADQ